MRPVYVLIFVTVVLFAGSLISSYNSRQDLVQSQRSGCTFSRDNAIDRDLDIQQFASRAADARAADGEHEVAAAYDLIADRAGRRKDAGLRRDCRVAYPDASWLPWSDPRIPRARQRYPLKTD